MNHINEFFEALIRRNLAIDQGDIAEKLGIKRQGLSEIKSGRVALRTEHIKKLWEEYDANPHYLVTGEGDMFIIKMQESSITQIGSIGNHNKGAISFGTVSECVEKVKGLESALEIQKTVIDMLKSEVDFLRKMLVDKEK